MAAARALALSAAAVVIAVTASAATLPAAEIVQRHLDAIGGAARWHNVHALLVRGTSPIASFVWVWKAPDRVRSEERDEQYTHSTLITAFDGKVAWTSNPFQGAGAPRRLGPDEAQRWESGVVLRSDLLDLPPNAELKVIGQEKVGGRDTYKLSLRRPGRDEVILWLDAQSFLVTQRARLVKTPWGEAKSIATPLGDYRNVQGLLIAHQIGETRCSVEVNPAVPDSLFQSPKPIQ